MTSTTGGRQASRALKRRLWAVIVLAAVFMVAEIIGGAIAKSLAIVADAAHILSDISGFVVSLIAIKLSEKKANSNYTYGFWQAEVIGALISIMIIWTTTIILLVEAIKRFISPEDVEGSIMFALAAAGLVVNIIMMVVLGHNHSHGHSHGNSHGHSHSHSHDPEEVVVPSEGGNSTAGSGRRHRNLALDAAFIHVLGDLIQSIGVIVAAVLIWTKPFDLGFTSDGVSRWNYFDPICTVLFSFLVLLSTSRTLKHCLHGLMQKVPDNIDVVELEKELKAIPQVECVHDVHVWNLGSAHALCTAHVVLIGCDNCGDVLAESKKVAQSMGISHATFQLEARSARKSEEGASEVCCHRDSCYTGESTCASP